MIYRAVNGLIRHAIEADLITNDNIFVVRNQLMDILKPVSYTHLTLPTSDLV